MRHMDDEHEGRTLLRQPTLTVEPAPPPDQTWLSWIFGEKNASTQRTSESLDYEPIQNKIFYTRMKQSKGKRHFYGYTGHTLAKFLITTLTGTMTGMIAVFLGKSVTNLQEYKNERIAEYLKDARENREDAGRQIFLAYLFHLAWSSGLVTVATAMVQYWAPAAAGAGVTLVMAYLNGNHVPNLLRWRTLVTKFVGTVCAVSAGLPMGPEGPMVHMGAGLASVITYLECKCLTDGRLLSCFGKRNHLDAGHRLKEKLMVLDEIVSDADHREFVSAGTAAGISAAFGAPIGGVLFAMEEACSFWSRKTAWRCFLAAVFATFTMTLVLGTSAARGMIGFDSLKDLEISDWLMQLPFMAFNGGMAGLLGAAFNSLRMWLWRVRASKTRHCLRIAEVVGLAWLCASCGFIAASSFGTCMKRGQGWEPEYGIKWLCDDSTEHNDMATLFLSSNHHTIRKLFSIGHNWDGKKSDFNPPFSINALVLYLIVYLVLMSIGAGVAIPGGMFMPSILVGATWGSFYGIVLHRILPPSFNVQPGLYALMAATGVLAGVFRSSMSLVVLVIEGSHGIQYMFGVILAVVMANFIAHHIHHDGVYESELERIGNICFLRDEAPHRLHTLTAEMIMATEVSGFREVDSVANIMKTLRDTTHNGFPVFHEDAVSGEPSTEGEANGPSGFNKDKQLAGVILRSQILVLLQRRHFCDKSGNPIQAHGFKPRSDVDLEAEMRTFYRHYFTHNRYISATSIPLEALRLDSLNMNLEEVYIRLDPYMNQTPMTVRKDCSASRVHLLFVSLGLRHLCIVDKWNNVVGIITRKDLDHAAGHGWWRMAHAAQAPKQTKALEQVINFGTTVKNTMQHTMHNIPHFLKLGRYGHTAGPSRHHQVKYQEISPEDRVTEHLLG